jgi:hypothetical protein
MHDHHTLQSLAAEYPAADETELNDLAKKYERRQQYEILDIAAVATDVSADSILNLGLEPESDPLIAEAFRLQYPHADPISPDDSLERLEGLANGIKGKYFELLVADHLNRGESLGELTLGPGQIAQIADSPTQAGWDVQIVNEDDGSVIEELQLKATDSMSYIKSALTEYPDIRVVALSDIDGVAEEILQTNISDADLEDAAHQYVGESSEDAVTDVLHQGAEWAFDATPVIPAILVAITEGKSVFVGRSSMDEALRRGARRMARAAAFSTLGATIAALHAGLLSVPATAAARIAWNRVANRIAMGELLELKARQIRVLTTQRGQGG